MIRILHSADWHLDSPLQGRSESQTALLRQSLARIPQQVCAAAKAENCQLMLLSGDLFDGAFTKDTLTTLKQAFAEVAIPVFIAPGNHDPFGPESPWQAEIWPENVHIFTRETIESIALPELDCRVYGAAFTTARAGSLLEGFRAEQAERYAVGVLHGDPTQATSPYCPITAGQIRESGLDYLALGHIHKGDRLRAGSTLCAWPGCPMGRGFDEVDAKGVLIVTLDEKGCQERFLPLDTPRFFDWECEAGEDAAASLSRLLPAAGSNDFYRVTLIGESPEPDTAALEAAFPQFPNLLLRDRTEPPLDLWAGAGEDTLEGVYFGMLQKALEGQNEETTRRILLAAKISRQILENREVKLP